MPITFKIAPILDSGSVPLASSMATLAEAFNTRLRSGVGDGTKRIHQYVNNLTRQIRNPSDEGNFPSLGEFPMYYQMLDYDTTPSIYPLTEAGDYEGANLAAPANQFVFGIGNEETGTPGEGDYLTIFDFFNTTESGSAAIAHWNLAKQQRGAYDPNTGAQSAPMFTLAQRYFRFTFPEWSRHGKAPGGYLPTLQQASTPCTITNTDSGETYYIPNWIYKFKPLITGLTPYTGSGTCGLDSNLDDKWKQTGGQSTDIAAVLDYPFAWYVYQYDGEFYTFRKTDYVLIKDGGGVLAREPGEQIERLMINSFIADYRGTADQRNQTCFETPYIDYAFANEDFYTSQYQLAPAYGVESGEYINASYPSYTWVTSQASGSSQLVVDIPSGFRLGGQLITLDKLTDDVSIRIMRGDEILSHFTASKASGSMVETFLNGPNSGSISYQFTSPLSFTDASGFLKVETSILLDYKPEIWDGYAMIRLSSAQGVIGSDRKSVV